LFCWSCGCSKQVVRPCDESPRRKSKQAGGGKASARAAGNVKKKQAAEEILVSSHENCKAPPLGTVTSYYMLPTEEGSLTPSMESLPTFPSSSVDDSLAPLGEGIDNGSPPDSLSVGVESVDGISQDITTLMICALPFRVTSEELLEAVDSLGFEGTYDFVYMPSRSTKKCGKVRPGNVGYAFVNFRKPEDAEKFAMIFPGYTFPGVESDKQILVRAAACQGYDANCCLHLFNKKHQSSVMTFPERISE
jgi:hypothetical protein